MTLAHKYSVSSPVAYLKYDTVLGDTELSPRLGLQAGATVAFVDFELRTTVPDEGAFGLPTTKTERVTDSSTEVGPYAGVEFLVPLGSSDWFAFGIVHKAWFQHQYTAIGETDVDLGPLVYGAGLAFSW